MIDIDVRTLGDRIGQEIAVSDWLEVTQERINQFADATGDHQWIHVDPARAAAESPFKTTIAHGFLTLSLRQHAHPRRDRSSRPADGDQLRPQPRAVRRRRSRPARASGRASRLPAVDAVTAVSRSPGRSRSSASGGDKPVLRRRVDRSVLPRHLARSSASRPGWLSVAGFARTREPRRSLGSAQSVS